MWLKRVRTIKYSSVKTKCEDQHHLHPTPHHHHYHHHHHHRHHSQRLSSTQTTTLNEYAIDDDDDDDVSTDESDSFYEDLQKRIQINVSGQQFEIALHLLKQHPSTLLGNETLRRRYYDRKKKEYFFDRHRPSFEIVFAYFQYGGKLRRPEYIPEDVFLNEIEFFQLEQDIIEDYKLSEGYTLEEVIYPENETLKKIWLTMEYPETSRTAYVVAVVSVVMTIVSIILFCVETLERFSKSHCIEDEAPNFLDAFFIIETVCTAWFTFEAIVRFISCPNKWLFWFGFQNIIDVTAVVPYYVTLFNVLSTMSCSTAKSSASLAFLRVIRLVRVFKLTKHSTGLQVLILTIKASSEELCLFLMVLLVCMLVYSSAIYYAEMGVPKSNINSIPDAFWWAIITMTTVGYGDKYPVGPFSKLIGAACAISGVLALAMPVPILTGHFNRFYAHKTGRCKYI
ncbi:hypothetical protein HELRODRAFT_67024 [Helobdella robusta]|uniref:BTB domain-containing protein n=1 Tax=Helobdella robusta TaxID=6412 RepID=T1FYV2_HELRO|nr:hypothetical protein HELRODRAFT_67024 [Helobdella robusta]ESN99006.1 hypothetical protein HELRODRAFT_67024 [Helobdella robusta]